MFVILGLGDTFICSKWCMSIYIFHGDISYLSNRDYYIPFQGETGNGFPQNTYPTSQGKFAIIFRSCHRFVGNRANLTNFSKFTVMKVWWSLFNFWESATLLYNYSIKSVFFWISQFFWEQQLSAATSANCKDEFKFFTKDKLY